MLEPVHELAILVTARLAAPLFKDGLRHRQRRHRVGPACVESQMGDDFGGLLFGQPIVQGFVQVKGDLLDLANRDQCGDRDKAAIAWRQAGAQPWSRKR